MVVGIDDMAMVAAGAEAAMGATPIDTLSTGIAKTAYKAPVMTSMEESISSKEGVSTTIDASGNHAFQFDGLARNLLAPVKVKETKGNVPSNMVPGLAPERLAKNTAGIAGTAMGAAFGVGVEATKKAVGEIKTGSMAEGQFIGGERDPTPAHAKLILKPPMFFVSGNDLQTRRLRI